MSISISLTLTKDGRLSAHENGKEIIVREALQKILEQKIGSNILSGYTNPDDRTDMSVEFYSGSNLIGIIDPDRLLQSADWDREKFAGLLQEAMEKVRDTYQNLPEWTINLSELK